MKMQTTLDIAADHPAFAGHFPAFPVLPGAALLDEMLYSIALARGIELRDWALSSAKFLAAVRPGESLTLQHDGASPGLIHFTILAGNRKVVSGTLHEP